MNARAWLGLLRFELPERDVRMATATAAAFNLLGMPIDLLLFRNEPNASPWPEIGSMAVGAVILSALALGRFLGRPSAVRTLFFVNGLAVALALSLIVPYFAAFPRPWLPFQGFKLGALVAGMLAPGFAAGLLTIVVTVGLPMAQIPALPAVLRSQVSPVEPWALFAFGLAAAFILVHRLRVRALEIRAREALAESEARRRLAAAYLELRDLMNTPLQSIELATVLLQTPQDRKPGDEAAILEALRRSSERLAAISRELKKFEHVLDRAGTRGGLDGQSAST